MNFKGETIEVVFPPNIDYLSSLLAMSRGLWENWGLDRKRIKRSEVALEEAIGVALDGRSLSDPLELEFKRVPLGVRTVLSVPAFVDLGEGRRVESLDDGPDLLGLFLMRNIVDHLSLRQGGNRTEIHMFSLLEDSVHPCDSQCVEELKSPHSEDFRLPSGGRIVSLDPDWIESAIRCAHSDDTMAKLHDYVFYKKRQIELMRSGVLFPMVALSEKGRVDGYIAIEKVSGRDGVAFLLPALVRNPMNSSLSDELYRKALQEAPLKDYLGLLGSVPVSNGKLLKPYEKFGFYECAALYGWGKKDRDNFWLLGRVLKDVDLPELYSPQKYRETISVILTSLGMNFSFGDERLSEPFSGRTMLSMSLDNGAKRVDITVISYGVDVVIKLRKCIDELELKDITSILIHLPLELPQTAQLAEELEAELSLIFCGVYPGFPGNSEILYMRRKNILPLPDSAAFSESGRVLLNQIRKGYSC